jgi:superfamily I DNA/RNA helicase
VLIEASDRADECTQILRAVDELLKGKHGLKGLDGPVQGSEIGILYPRRMPGERRIFNAFLAKLREHGPVVWLSDPQDRDARRRVGEPGIKVQTIHAAKGLQYRVVILMWADLLPSDFPDSDKEAERRLMYVALTRPEDMLVITCSNDSAFIHDVRNTGKVELR